MPLKLFACYIKAQARDGSGRTPKRRRGWTAFDGRRQKPRQKPVNPAETRWSIADSPLRPPKYIWN